MRQNKLPCEAESSPSQGFEMQVEWLSPPAKKHASPPSPTQRPRDQLCIKTIKSHPSGVEPSQTAGGPALTQEPGFSHLGLWLFLMNRSFSQTLMSIAEATVFPLGPQEQAGISPSILPTIS